MLQLQQNMDFEQGTSILQNGVVKGSLRHARTAHNMSSSSLRKKSDLTLVSKVRLGCLRQLLVNLQEVVFGTRIWILFPAVPLAVLADSFGFARVSAVSFLKLFSDTPIFGLIFSIFSLCVKKKKKKGTWIRFCN